MNKIPNIKFSINYFSNKEALYHFKKYGWVSLKNVITKKEIKNLEKDIDKISLKICGLKFQDAIKKFYIKNKKKLYEISIAVEKSSYNIFLANKFIDFYKKFSNENNSYINLGQYILPGAPGDKRLVYNFHQENSYFPKYKETIHFHFPLFHDATLESGAMSALSKTHKLGTIKRNKVEKQKKGFLSIIPKNIDQLVKNYEHDVFNLKISDLLIFSGNLIHKSNTNFSKKCRIIGIHRFAKI